MEGRRLIQGIPFLASCAIFFVVVAGGEVRAEAPLEEASRIALEPFKGPQAVRIRSKVARALKQGSTPRELVEPPAVAKAARRLRVNPKTADGQVKVAADLGLVAWVSVTISAKRGFSAVVTVRSGRDGEAMAPVTVSAKSRDALAAEIVRAVLETVDSFSGTPRTPEVAAESLPTPVVAAPPPAAETPPAETSRVAADAPATPSRVRRHTALEAKLGLLLFSRRYRYDGDSAGVLRPYSLKLGPAPRLGLRWFPGAHFTEGVAAHVGIVADAEFALGLASKNEDDLSFPTSAASFSAGLTGRIPLGAHSIAAAAAFGRQTFSVGEAEDGTNPDVPDVGYSFIRIGADARFVVADILVLCAGGGYRLLLGVGEVGTDAWFKGAGASGFDAFIAVGVELAMKLGFELGVEIRQYGLSLSDTTGAARAEGASDRYLGATVGVTWGL